jgi:hypothetical protein
LRGNAAPEQFFGDGGGIANISGVMTVAGSTLSGNTGNDSGAIFNGGILTVTSSTLSSNTASSGGGGAIFNTNGGILTVLGSTLRDNAAQVGGAIYNIATVTVNSSTLSGNTAASDGGGIHNSTGSIRVTNSTLSGNTAASNGGGISTGNGFIALTNSTLSGNAATGAGGGIDQSSGRLVLSYVTVASNTTGIVTSGPPAAAVALTGTIVANSTAGPNCSGPVMESAGYNLDSGTSCGFSRPTDITATNPLLSPLASRGGPTATMALLPGSPAIGHGATRANGCPPTDQRWVPRPPVAACAIGAYERVAVTP